MVPSWKYLVAAPHRVMFCGGMVQAVLAVAWWLSDLLGRYAGVYPVVGWRVAPMWAHFCLMMYGLLPFFMFGFLMTSMPNWLGAVSLLLWLATDNALLLGFARHAGVWFFLLPIFFSVSHRMVPFFSSRVLDH